LATANNLGLVRVEPLDGGGHTVTFTVFEYDPKRDRLSEAFTDVAAPAPPDVRYAAHSWFRG
jgi:hypothetical protein